MNVELSNKLIKSGVTENPWSKHPMSPLAAADMLKKHIEKVPFDGLEKEFHECSNLWEIVVIKHRVEKGI